MLTAIGPIHLPSAPEIRETIRKLAYAGGRHTPVGLVPTMESSRWEYRPHDVIGPIDVLEPCVVADVPQVLTRLAAANPSSRPLNVAVAGKFLFLDISHGLGDGRLGISLVHAVSGGRAGSATPAWASSRDSRFPLVRSLARTFLRSPGRLAQLGHPLRRDETASSSDAPSSPEPTVPWSRAPTVVISSARTGVISEIRTWRDRELPGVSVSALLFVAVARAIGMQGISITNDVDVLVDCRRYLPRGAKVIGNFAAGVRLLLSDPTDPLEMSSAIAQATTSGRPLASLALSAMKFRGAYYAGRVALAAPDTVAAEPRLRLVFSDLGNADLLENLDWADEPSRRLVTALSEPADPGSIVFTFIRRGPELDVSASLHDNVFDPECVRKALDEALRNPVSLLSRRKF